MASSTGSWKWDWRVSFPEKKGNSAFEASNTEGSVSCRMILATLRSHTGYAHGKTDNRIIRRFEKIEHSFFDDSNFFSSKNKSGKTAYD